MKIEEIIKREKPAREILFLISMNDPPQYEGYEKNMERPPLSIMLPKNPKSVMEIFFFTPFSPANGFIKNLNLP
ncbi:MAG: hypothetical protein HZA02_04550 [Nitrospinae bacterium]|nr:hypothetical protein [Nitrospinota bacterium]